MTDLKRWLLLLRVPAALLGVFLFFSLYNRFILDTNLRNLQVSLSVLDTTIGVGQAEAALLLVDQTLIAQMGKEDLELKPLATLQYAQGTLAADQPQRPVEDAQAMLEILGKERAAARPTLLNPLDGMAVGMQTAFQRVTLFPRQVFGRSGFPEIDDAQLQEAAHLERLGQFSESAAVYTRLLQDYPNYTGCTSLKLRLGYVYQRAQNLARAEQLYREVEREARSVREIQTARLLLEQLSRVRSTRKEVKSLEQSLSTLAAGPERQRLAFKLGSLLIRLYDLQKAAGAFRAAVLADPEGELALPALFKEGWCLRTGGRLEEALARFSEAACRDPKGSWGASAYLQIAEIYKATGNYAAAAALYEQVSSQSKDDALNAFSTACAGSLYLFDLNNPEKAHLFFRDLEKRFPASPFSSIGARIRDLQERKGVRIPTDLPVTPIAPMRGGQPPKGPVEISLEEGGPLMNWLESFLPVFVDVFSDRLAKYMKAIGVKNLARRFTENEFRDLVVSQIQKRFPGQVTDIQTKIHPDGFIGSGSVRLGILRFSIEARIGITVVDEKPNAEIQEVRVGKLAVPNLLRKVLETRVNRVIGRAKYPLKVKRYELKEGYTLISVELADEDST